MKLQNPQQQVQRTNLSNQNLKNSTQGNETSNVSFKRGEAITQFLTFLQTNQAIGATFVDAGFMCTPRTAVDFTRGSDAGIETARREFSSNFNDAALGAYGVGAAWLLSRGMNKEYGLNDSGMPANKMFIDNETLDILSDIWNKDKQPEKTNLFSSLKKILKGLGPVKTPEAESAAKANEQTKNLNTYFKEAFTTVEGFNPHHSAANDSGYVPVKDSIDKLVEKMVHEVQNGNDKSYKDARAYSKALLVRETGAESEFKLQREVFNPKTGKKEVVKSVTSADNLIDSVYKFAKASMNDKVVDAKTGKISENFISSLKKLNTRTAILGVAMCSVLGACVQPLNMYLTKKKTGKSGFVGGGEENKSNKFKMVKLGVGATAAYAALRSVGKMSEIIGKIQFKGIIPTIPQFKVAYGITIVSRLLAARNENELRESSIKDSLGFANWLILGGFVSKLAASGLEKAMKDKGEKFIKYNEKENGKGIFNWLTKSSILTREEVLHEGLKKAGVDVIKGGKAMTFKEMLKEAAIVDAKTGSKIRTKIKYLGLIQAAGYLWSGLALGIGIPKLNIAITNSVEKKKKHQVAVSK